MLDIKFIRENKNIVEVAAKKKRFDIDIDRLIKVDDERKKRVTEVEKKKSGTKCRVRTNCKDRG